MYFIIWSYLDGSIRVEKTNTLLKTHTHRCEHPLRDARNLYIHRRKIKTRLLRRFAPRNDSSGVIATPSAEQKAWQSRFPTCGLGNVLAKLIWFQTLSGLKVSWRSQSLFGGVRKKRLLPIVCNDKEVVSFRSSY
jgi:hypothetical protein